MLSTLTWLDHSEKDRRRALDVIDLFREQDTVDELGLGTVRDAFADQLFPGTSTVQTRLRYFLFVPWIYRDLEERKVGSARIAQEARKREVALIEPLAAREGRGVIGRRARKAVKRLPSSIYWGGLGVWGIRLVPGSQDDYHRSLNAHLKRRATRSESGSDPESESLALATWHPHLPDTPDDFPASASFRLLRKEAEYLRDRLALRVPKSLLAWLAQRERPWKEVDGPWELEALGGMSAEHRRLLAHVRCFTKVFHGATLLYHLLLAKEKNDKKRIGLLREALAEWARECARRERELAAWDLRDLWAAAEQAGARVGSRTRQFVESWVAWVRQESGRRVADSAEARELVTDREARLKGPRARLGNPRQLELWRGIDRPGPLDFRWTVSQRLLLELLDGLKRKAR